MDPKDIKADVPQLALPLLVERLGGTVEITEAEYEAFMERHAEDGRKPGVQIERTDGAAANDHPRRASAAELREARPASLSDR
jgi:hypothetical protein